MNDRLFESLFWTYPIGGSFAIYFGAELMPREEDVLKRRIRKPRITLRGVLITIGVLAVGWGINYGPDSLHIVMILMSLPILIPPIVATFVRLRPIEFFALVILVWFLDHQCLGVAWHRL
jgi:hypothetical protein